MNGPFVIGLGIGTCLAVMVISFGLAALGLTWAEFFGRRV